MLKFIKRRICAKRWIRENKAIHLPLFACFAAGPPGTVKYDKLQPIYKRHGRLVLIGLFTPRAVGIKVGSKVLYQKKLYFIDDNRCTLISPEGREAALLTDLEMMD